MKQIEVNSNKRVCVRQSVGEEITSHSGYKILHERESGNYSGEVTCSDWFISGGGVS